jgi:hypothetical protein
VAAAVLLAAGNCYLALGQAPPTILTIDVANLVEYQADIYEPSKWGSNPNVTPWAGAREFDVVTILADIVAVNGKPAKGLYAGQTRVIGTTPDSVPGTGKAIADVKRIAMREHMFEILQPDGTPIGTIMSFGFSGGNVPPGAPSGPRGGNWTIVGGTGAFLGARGQVEGWGGTEFSQGGRAASMSEDAANRRINGGGTSRFTLHVIPMQRPKIVITSDGPPLAQSSDLISTRASAPAMPGEVLSLVVTGLGPVRPGIDPGEPFPSDPLAEVNSPIEITVNGKSAEVLRAVGKPGSVDTYQVNFRLPLDTAIGAASLQVAAAWIRSAPVSIAIHPSTEEAK